MRRSKRTRSLPKAASHAWVRSTPQAVAAEPVVALDAAAGDAIFDAAQLPMRTTACEVIALVCMQLGWPAAWPSRLASDSRQRVYQRLEDHRVVAVGTSDAEHERDAVDVRHEVALHSEPAAVRRVGPGVQTPPGGLATLAPSMLARPKSSLSAPRNSASSSRCSRCHTSAACQSRNLRQHVMPLPKPNSWGNSSPHGMPVRSTNRMPWRADSSSSRGSTRFHSAALISLVLVSLHRRSPIAHRTARMIGFC